MEFPKKSYFGVLGVIFISKKIKILDKIASNWPFLPNLIKINLNIFILLFTHTICLEYLKDSAHQFPTLIETPPDTHPKPPNQVGFTPYSSACLLACLLHICINLGLILRIYAPDEKKIGITFFIFRKCVSYKKK